MIFVAALFTRTKEWLRMPVNALTNLPLCDICAGFMRMIRINPNNVA